MPKPKLHPGPDHNAQARDDRANTHLVAAHVDTDAYREFKILAAEELRTTDAMVHEAIALLFAKYKKPIPPPISRKLKQLGIPGF